MRSRSAAGGKSISLTRPGRFAFGHDSRDVLCLRNTQGQMALIEASPEGYREMGRFSQPKRSRFATFAHPVVANGRLYLRDDDLLFCYDIAGKKDRR